MSYRLILLTSERFAEFSTRIFKASHTRVAKNTFVGDPMFLTKGFALVNKFVSKFSGVVNIFFSVLENLQLRLLFSYMHFFYYPGRKFRQTTGILKKLDSIVLHCVFPIDSWFQGCVALLRYNSEAKPFENVKLLGSKGVWENCSGEACSSSEQNKCTHGGICVDLVVKTECDCKETGYYGRFCERSGNER